MLNNSFKKKVSAVFGGKTKGAQDATAQVAAGNLLSRHSLSSRVLSIVLSVVLVTGLCPGVGLASGNAGEAADTVQDSQVVQPVEPDGVAPEADAQDQTDPQADEDEANGAVQENDPADDPTFTTASRLAIAPDPSQVQVMALPAGELSGIVSVATAEELYKAVAAPAVTGITLTADITIDQPLTIDRELTVQGATLSRSDRTKSVFVVTSTGSLSLANITLADNGADGNASKYASAIVTSGTLNLNARAVVNGFKAADGGAVYAKSGSSVNIDEAMLSNNMACGTSHAAMGGAVYAESGSSIVMTSGLVDGNVACSANSPDNRYGGMGGGFCLATGASMVMKNGTISHNQAGYYSSDQWTAGRNGAGGGVFVNTQAGFVMNNGTVSDNTAWAGTSGVNYYGGGGICIWNSGGYDFSGSAQINAGSITGNTSVGVGGGVYVHNYRLLPMHNAAVVSNAATINGGGLYLCMVGEVYNYATDCTIFTNNAAAASDYDAQGDDIWSDEPWYGSKANFHLPERTESGLPITWYEDTRANPYTDASEPIDDFPNWFESNKNNNVGLRCDAPYDAANYAVLISGNTAKQGGGIGCNGILEMCNPDADDVSLTVKKVWAEDENSTEGNTEEGSDDQGLVPVADLGDDQDGNDGQDGNGDQGENPENPAGDNAIEHPEVTVNIFNGNKKIDSVVLNEENNWTATLTGLPADGNYSVVEEEVEGYESTVIVEQTSETSWEFAITNTPITSVTVSKVWEDADDQDGLRPESVSIQLKADDEDYDDPVSVTVDTDGNWTYTFENLPAYASGKKIVYTVEEASVPNGYEASVSGTAEDGFTITNTHTVEMIDIPVSKTWEDGDNVDGIRPTSITLQLKADGAIQGDPVEVTADENGVWAHTFTNLPKNKLVEGTSTAIEYTVEELNVTNGYTARVSGDAESGITLTNSHTPDVVSLSVSKNWQDANNQDGIRPTSITLQLKADGKDLGDPVQVVADSDGNWTHTFNDLPKNKRVDGVTKAIAYTVDEVNVSEGYEAQVAATAATANGNLVATVTNTHTPATISIPVKKVWNDANNQDGKRSDSVTVQLIKTKTVDGTSVTESCGAPVVLSDDNDWAHTFENLAKYEAGNEIAYSVAEVSVPDGYASVIEGGIADGFTITNSHTPATVSVPVSKKWADADNQDGVRPTSVTVRLLANGADTGKSVTLSEGNGWKASFDDLDEYEGGKKIVYTVAEDEVAGYEASISGSEDGLSFVITNTHQPEKTSVSGTKTWADNDDQDGIRPAFVTVSLMANDQAVASQKVTADKNGMWSYSFDDLPKYAGGVQISYSVVEDVPEGYAASYSGFDIANTHQVEKTSVSGAKTWSDASDQDGKRPSSIHVKLMNGQVLVAQKDVTEGADGRWTYTFDDLPKYDHGVEISYSVVEDVPEGYQATYDGTNIINSYTPGKVAVGVAKSWSDDVNRDGLRPSSVTVHLFANGADTGKSVTLSEGNGWKASFDDLDEYAGGKKIVYTVAEDEVAGYEAVISGSEDGLSFVITNTHQPEKTSVSGTKTWNDASNQDGLRPKNIKLGLFDQDGMQLIKTVVLTAADATAENGNVWAYEFTDLNKYKNVNGTATQISYVVRELDANDVVLDKDAANGAYFVDYDGTAISNRHMPSSTSVKVSKTWNDMENRDGLRPESVTVKLLADGVETDKSVTLNEENGWTASFEGLDEFKAGKRIVYTVAEVEVAGYAVAITGNATDGFTITNTEIVFDADFAKADLGGVMLAGAKLKVVDSNNKVIAQWESGLTANRIKLAPGAYTFIEEEAPAGYALADPISFEVANDGTVTVGGQAVGTVTMTDALAEAFIDVDFEKYLYALDTNMVFDFTLAECDQNGQVGAATAATPVNGVIDADKPVSLTVQNGQFDEFGQAAIDFPQLRFTSTGTHYYRVWESSEATDGSMVMDESWFLLKVVVTADANGNLEAQLASSTLTYDGEAYEVGSDEFYFCNNEMMTLSCMAMSYAASPDEAQTVSINPVVKKELQNGALTQGAFAFTMVETTPGVAQPYKQEATNDANGTVAFDLLTFSNTGTHTYEITEVAGADDLVVYDQSIFTLTVDVVLDQNGALKATASYELDGQPVDVATFVNKARTPVLRVQKTSKDGSHDPLQGAYYGLWMVNAHGADVYLGAQPSDQDGFITFDDVDLQVGEEYYFKEESAPEGHTVDEYRSDTFTVVLDQQGYRLVIQGLDRAAEPMVLAAAAEDAQGTTADDRVVLTYAQGVQDEVTKLSVSKFDAGTHEAVEGATMQIIEERTGILIKEWETGKQAVDINRVLNVDTPYILREVKAPNGYACAQDTYFVINEHGDVTVNDGNDAEVTGKFNLAIYDTRLAVQKTVTEEDVVKQDDRYVTSGSIAKTGDYVLIAVAGGLTLVAVAAVVAIVVARRRKDSAE